MRSLQSLLDDGIIQNTKVNTMQKLTRIYIKRVVKLADLQSYQSTKDLQTICLDILHS